MNSKITDEWLDDTIAMYSELAIGASRAKDESYEEQYRLQIEAFEAVAAMRTAMPCTRDGVPIFPGMSVWFPADADGFIGHAPYECRVKGFSEWCEDVDWTTEEWLDENPDDELLLELPLFVAAASVDKPYFCRSATDCYSTKEAAEAAAKEAADA